MESGVGRGAIQASLDGSIGKAGKYLECRLERKSGSEGSSGGGWGGCGKWIVGAGRRAAREEAGWRFGGGTKGAASGSEVGLLGILGGTPPRPTSSGGDLKVTFLVDAGFFMGSVGSSVSNKEGSVPTSVRPSSMFAFRSSRSMREGLSPANSSCRSRAISSGDISAILFRFSSSIRFLSASSHEDPTSTKGSPPSTWSFRRVPTRPEAMAWGS